MNETTAIQPFSSSHDTDDDDDDDDDDEEEEEEEEASGPAACAQESPGSSRFTRHNLTTPGIYLLLMFYDFLTVQRCGLCRELARPYSLVACV
jgi:hypothetical protein